MAQIIVGLGGKCMDIRGAVKDNGTPIVLYPRHDGLNQQWELTADRYLVSPLDPSKCLGVQGLTPDNGTPIILWDKDGGPNQQWTYHPDGTLTCDMHPNRCIDVQGGIDKDETPLILWDRNGGANQKWSFVDLNRSTNFDSSTIQMCLDKIMTGPPHPPRTAPPSPPIKTINSDGSISEHQVTQQPIVGVTEKFWNVGQTIRVKMLAGMGTAFVRSKVRQFAEIWMQHANIRFEFVEPSAAAEIRISFVAGKGVGAGNWSFVGRDALGVLLEEATMNFGHFDDQTPDWKFSRVVLHEFGHALGLVHEHQSPVRGINWDKEKAYKFFCDVEGWDKAKVDRNIFQKYSNNNTNFSQYDPASIMHYSVDAALTLDNVGVEAQPTLSPVDIQFIRKWYPFPPTPQNAVGMLRTGDDCDEIDFAIEYKVVFEDSIEFNLSGTPGVVTWWKAIGIPTGNAGYTMIEANNGSNDIKMILKSKIDSSRPIQFWKAKFLGIHTRLNFTWEVLSALPGGCRVNLTWKKDHC